MKIFLKELELSINDDVYFDSRLGGIYAGLECGEYQEFLFEDSLGTVSHSFIIRPINERLKNKTNYYDLTTPYGYGGPLILECNDQDRSKLIEHFFRAFADYCSENNIVSEFIRFHPLADNANDFGSFYSAEIHNYTVATNLFSYDDPFMSEFSKSCRKNVRRGLRAGLDYEIDTNPTSLEEFYKIYYETMDRNQAKDIYYFDEKYFEKFIETMPENIITCKVIYQDKTIAMGFYLRTDEILHTHLSGTLSDYLDLSPAYILRYGLLQWGLENGIKLIHHGGGTTGSEKDSLFLFKKQFGRNTILPFYLGKKIWNQSVYDQLVKINEVNPKTGFFPAYRSLDYYQNR